ncbi:MAG: N-6 DNA methylase [Thiomargarita sp.]|nr:N-6 DNA methylase [Thiomargarita sp.]
MNTITHIAQQLWAPAKRFRQDGLSSQTYLTELMWLLCLKITTQLPPHLSWESLIQKEGTEQYYYYLELLDEMECNDDPHIAGIYAYAETSLKKPEQLAYIIIILSIVDTISNYELGEVFELLLEYCAHENNNRLHIAPRALVDLMIVLTQPHMGEVIQDPMAGIGSIVVAADQYINVINDSLLKKKQNIIALETDLIRQRLALMNCFLHDITHSQYVPVRWKDSLLLDQKSSPTVDVILSILVFINNAKNEEDHYDASLALLQYIYNTLKPGGRAAVVLPDNILKAMGPAQHLREVFLNKCVVHTVLRLPNGIFYPYNGQAHLLFFTKSKTPAETTQRVWVYDLRTCYPTFGKKRTLTRQHLREFEMLYGDDPLGEIPRHPNKRWHCVNRHTLTEQDDRLDLSCVQDETVTTDFETQEKIWKLLEETTTELDTVTHILHS